MSERYPQSEPELVEFIRSIDVAAPAELQRRIAALETGARQPPARARVAIWRGPLRTRGWALAGGGLLALGAALALALTSGGGSGSRATLERAAALADAQATEAAPQESHSRPHQLSVAVDGLAFPYWQDSLGWRDTGARRDALDGTQSATVYYVDRSGMRIGYTILGGRIGHLPGRVMWRNGTAYHTLALQGLRSVVWLRDGRTCVLASRAASYRTLMHLASWRSV